MFNLMLLMQGVQPLLDGVLNYLPCPIEVSNYALDQTKNEEKVANSLKVNPCFTLICIAIIINKQMSFNLKSNFLNHDYEF